MKHVVTLVSRVILLSAYQKQMLLLKAALPAYLFVTAIVWCIGQFAVLPFLYQDASALATATIAWFLLAFFGVAVCFAGIGYLLFMATVFTHLGSEVSVPQVVPTPASPPEHTKETNVLDAEYRVLEEIS